MAREIVDVPLAQILGRRPRSTKVEALRRAFEDEEDVPPVKLRQVAVDRFQVIDGRHRVAAAERAGYQWIAAEVLDPAEEDDQ